MIKDIMFALYLMVIGISQSQPIITYAKFKCNRNISFCNIGFQTTGLLQCAVFNIHHNSRGFYASSSGSCSSDDDHSRMCSRRTSGNHCQIRTNLLGDEIVLNTQKLSSQKQKLSGKRKLMVNHKVTQELKVQRTLKPNVQSKLKPQGLKKTTQKKVQRKQTLMAKYNVTQDPKVQSTLKPKVQSKQTSKVQRIQKLKVNHNVTQKPKVQSTLKPKVESKQTSKVQRIQKLKVNHNVTQEPKVQSTLKPKVESKQTSKVQRIQKLKVNHNVTQEPKVQSTLKPKVESKLTSKVQRIQKLKVNHNVTQEPNVQSTLKPKVESKLTSKVQRKQKPKIKSKAKRRHKLFSRSLWWSRRSKHRKDTIHYLLVEIKPKDRIKVLRFETPSEKLQVVRVIKEEVSAKTVQYSPDRNELFFVKRTPTKHKVISLHLGNKKRKTIFEVGVRDEVKILRIDFVEHMIFLAGNTCLMVYKFVENEFKTKKHDIRGIMDMEIDPRTRLVSLCLYDEEDFQSSYGIQNYDGKTNPVLLLRGPCAPTFMWRGYLHIVSDSIIRYDLRTLEKSFFSCESIEDSHTYFILKDFIFAIDPNRGILKSDCQRTKSIFNSIQLKQPNWFLSITLFNLNFT